LSDVLAVVAFGIAATAVFRERGALSAIGVPDAAVKAFGLWLYLVALIIAGGAIMRELKRRGGDRPIRPTARRATV
jgi:hypothetical protein